MRVLAFFVLLSASCMTLTAIAVDSPRPSLTFAPVPLVALTESIRLDGTNASVRADTTWFGDYRVIAGEYYARSALNDKRGVMWTFDRNNGPSSPPSPLIPNGEGFSCRDLTTNTSTYFRVIDASTDLGQSVLPPIIAGAKSLWVGLTGPEARELCWTCEAGYGNEWCQRITSPPIAYNGTGSVSLSFRYFQNSEPCYDGTLVYLRRADSSELLLNPYAPGTCTTNPQLDGGFTDSIASYRAPAIFGRTLLAAEIGAAQDIRLVFEFSSDGGWSDEDGNYCTTWGPFGMDELRIIGGGIDFLEDWEGGLGSWTPGYCSPIGSYVGVVDLGCYTILDPCACRLQGNIVEFHAGQCDEGYHPTGQHCWIESPIVDTGDSSIKSVFADFDVYAIVPLENGVLYRPGWKYFPFTCVETGQQVWSDRVGAEAFGYGTADPFCASVRTGGTALGEAGTPVPGNARMVRFLLEVEADCSAFSIDPCSGVTNATPLFDNIAVGVTAGATAPIVSFDFGTYYQDVGSYLQTDPNGSGHFNPRMAGPANVTRAVPGSLPTSPHYCGDSLVIMGPMPSPSDPNTRWEARMWWRVARRSPFNADRENGTTSRYKTWRDRVADGRVIDRPYSPQFTWGWMDSNQVGIAAYRNRFVSSFREDDDDFVGEGLPENEMIWDDILYPGTRIEYFVTSDYWSSPNHSYYLPDTTGANFLEFEILPGVRVANIPGCGGTGFNYCAAYPATLYIHAGGPAAVVENALRTILDNLDPCDSPYACAIPADRSWDRYDYADAASSWNAPFARDIPGSNNGMTLSQILGYRTIILHTGGASAGATEEADYWLYDQWLRSPLCDGNVNRQVFIMNGIKTGELLMNSTWTEGYGSGFLNGTLGALLKCEAFNGISEDPACAPPTTDFCVRWLPVSGGSFPTELDVDVWGNYCPYSIGFNVFELNGGGVGNRYYQTEAGDKTDSYSQVTNQTITSEGNYRTILDGADWFTMTRRNPGGAGNDVCPRDIPSIIAGCISELGGALKWGFDATSYSGIPRLASVKVLAQCQGTWNLPADAEAGPTGRIDRLYQAEPNPFSPRTRIPFSLARDGSVTLAVYDVNGRLVRTLQQGRLSAGAHSVVWDGTRNDGNRVPSGVYWVQMKAGSYVSNKRMVMVR
jgi:hypothetical protein